MNGKNDDKLKSKKRTTKTETYIILLKSMNTVSGCKSLTTKSQTVFIHNATIQKRYFT